MQFQVVATLVSLLSQHPEWRSIPIDPVSHRLSGLGMIKTWRTRAEDGRFKLQEATELSIHTQGGVRRWDSGELDLTGNSAGPLNLFEIDDETSAYRDLRIERLTGDRFALHFIRNVGGRDTPLAIYFSPRPVIDLQRTAQPMGFPVYRAPWVSLPALKKGILRVPYLPMPLPRETEPLRHELTRKKQVWVDPAVPPAFLSSIRLTLDRYNTILGTTLFEVRPSGAALSSEDCLSSNDRLCVLWEGPRDRYSWLIGGETMIAYDPLSGAILGGSIVMKNNVINTPQLPFSKSPEKLTQTYFQNAFRPADLVELEYSVNRLATYAHPEPAKIFLTAFAHEIGHYLGFPHDYKGSVRGTPQHPTESLMEYPSFAVFHLIQGPQPKDVAKLRALYHAIPYSGPASCTDEDIFDDPTCLAWDLGDPVEWMLTVARIDPRALFTPSPMMAFYERRLGMRPRPIDRLARMLTVRTGVVTPAQKKAIVDYLCSRTDVLPSIRSTLNQTGFALICPE